MVESLCRSVSNFATATSFDEYCAYIAGGFPKSKEKPPLAEVSTYVVSDTPEALDIKPL
jgi:hypothetical protein